MIYKISYVVEDESSPGILKNESKRPEVGDMVAIANRQFKVIDVAEIMPPKNEEVYLLVMLEEKRT